MIEPLSNSAIQSSLKTFHEDMLRADKSIKALCKGRRVRIISDFNGQVMGRSKPPLTGKEFTVTHAFYDTEHIVLWLDMDRGIYSTNALGLDEVEFL